MGTSYNPKIVTNGLVLNLDPANVKSYPANQDPFVNNVSLMLAMDGANNSTTFTDSSQNALAVTAVADAKISTAQSKFGGSAAYFDGTGDYLTVANNTVNAFGLGDFTIECWVNFSALPGTAGQNMGIANTMTSTGSATFTHWWLGLLNSAGTLRLHLGRHGNGDVFAYVNWTPALNTWYHIAVTRSSSSVVSMFINGVSQSVTTSGSNWANNFSATGILSIGLVATALTFNGYIDDFRLTRAARYTASFTPPSAPFSLPGRLTDLTKNKISSTLTNTTFTSSNGGLLTYNGSSSTTVGSSAITGVSEFTVMVWFNSNSIANYRNPLDFNYTFYANGNVGPRLEIYTGGRLVWIFSGNTSNGAVYTGAEVVASNLQANTWYCCVITRSSTSTINTYLNGVYSQSSMIDSGSNGNAFVGSFNKITTGVGYANISQRYHSGYVSIILAYNRALTAAEVLQNYNATKGRFV